MTEIFRPDIKVTDLIGQGQFTVSAEIIPPRNGTPQSEILSQIDQLSTAGAQFLSVTKGAGGSLRGGSLPIAQVIKDHFKIPVIAHFTCRDLPPEEVENQLMDHHYFGIRNILGLRGDPPNGVTNWKPNENSHPYAYQLIDQIHNMNRGSFLERIGFKPKQSTTTDFCIGAAAYPDDATFEQRISFFLKKYQSGASYGITQMIYDPESYKKFVNDLADNGCEIPVLPGARILRTQAQADRMRSKFGIKIPDSFYRKLPQKEEPLQSLNIFLELVESFKNAGAPGLHVFVLVDTELSCQAIKTLRS